MIKIDISKWNSVRSVTKASFAVASIVFLTLTFSIILIIIVEMNRFFIAVAMGFWQYGLKFLHSGIILFRKYAGSFFRNVNRSNVYCYLLLSNIGSAIRKRKMGGKGAATKKNWASYTSCASSLVHLHALTSIRPIFCFTISKTSVIFKTPIGTQQQVVNLQTKTLVFLNKYMICIQNLTCISKIKFIFTWKS